jgi:hypothetical protein
MRVNLSVAIVAMVNKCKFVRPPHHLVPINNNCLDLPAPDGNNSGYGQECPAKGIEVEGVRVNHK